MSSPVLRASEEHLREIPIDPIWIGVITLAIFLVLLFVLLAFGKGRPHT